MSEHHAHSLNGAPLRVRRSLSIAFGIVAQALPLTVRRLEPRFDGGISLNVPLICLLAAA